MPLCLSESRWPCAVLHVHVVVLLAFYQGSLVSASCVGVVALLYVSWDLSKFEECEYKDIL